MENLELKNICQEACNVVRHVGAFLKDELGNVQASAIEIKSLNSLVSYVDKEAEKRLVRGLSDLIPEAVFLTEEETVEQAQGEYQWIIDPLDGTTNFLHQLPFFSISVALRYKETIIIGIVLEINRSECFYAWKDGGAWLNGQSIKVSTNAVLGDALLATGFPYYDYEHTEAYLEILAIFMKNTRGLRRFGSAAIDLAYVACGRFDAYYEYSLNAWDVAGGILLVQEAGGKVSDFTGGGDYLFGRQIIAGSSGVHSKVLEVVKEKF